jgi:hypothetical protein
VAGVGSVGMILRRGVVGLRNDVSSVRTRGRCARTPVRTVGRQSDNVRKAVDIVGNLVGNV